MTNIDLINSLSPESYLNQLIDSCIYLQLIYTITKLGIPDLLHTGAKSCEELAAMTNSHLPSLHRILRTLSVSRILKENPDGRFELTPVSRLLRSNTDTFFPSGVLLTGDPEFFRVHAYLYNCVKTGEIPFTIAHNTGYFEFLEKNPDKAEIFTAHMTKLSYALNKTILRTYDFSQYKTIIDIGGGEGTLISAILKMHPGKKGILYEKAAMIETAKQFLIKNAIKCRCIPGDFFISVPREGDIYILQKVLHDWDDENALKILKNCHKAMKKSGKILIIEMIMPSDNSPSITYLTDIMMMNLTGGMERTKQQFSGLLTNAGFSLTKIYPLVPEIFIIEAVKA